MTEAEVEAGRAQMEMPRAEFLVRQEGRGARSPHHAHNSVNAWFVREAMQAPDWRWMTLNQANCGLTVLAQKSGRPWTLVCHNDLAHLPFELRTGLPEVPLV